MRAAHPMEDPFQLPWEFHTDLMSPSLLSALKQPTGPYGTPVIRNVRCFFMNKVITYQKRKQDLIDRDLADRILKDSSIASTFSWQVLYISTVSLSQLPNWRNLIIDHKIGTMHFGEYNVQCVTTYFLWLRIISMYCEIICTRLKEQNVAAYYSLFILAIRILLHGSIQRTESL